MKSIKIQNKRNVFPKSQNIEPKSIYQAFITKNPNFGLRQQLGSCVAEICKMAENRTAAKLNLQTRIKNWLQNGQKDEQMPAILEQFRKFILEAFEQLIKKNQSWQKSEHIPQKLIRIKSEQRIKLRLLKQNESPTDELYETDIVKQQHQKQKQIYDLRTANKRLQRKIVLLGTEFNQLKNMYETKIEKYKRIINSSIGQLQRQIDSNLEEDHGSPHDYEANIRYNQLQSPRQDRARYQNVRSARSDYYRGTEIGSKTEKLTTQESQKFVTIPTIPAFDSVRNFDRQFSHKNYRGS